jgi:hypothetical protein
MQRLPQLEGDGSQSIAEQPYPKLEKKELVAMNERKQ